MGENYKDWGIEPLCYGGQVTHKDRWVNIFVAHEWFTEQAYRDALQAGNVEPKEFISSLTARGKYKQTLSEVVTKAAEAESYVSYATMEQMIPVDLLDISDEEVTQDILITVIANNIDEGKDPLQWIVDVSEVLRGVHSKKRSVVFLGDATSGKTLLSLFICCMYKPHQVGLVSNQNSKSPFWLQDLVGKSIYLAEELTLEDANVQTSKMLLENNPMLKTDMKYAERQYLAPRPVIITANLPIWRYVSQESVPIRERCMISHFSKVYKPELVKFDRKLQAIVWTDLVNIARQSRQPSSVSSSSSSGRLSVTSYLIRDAVRSVEVTGDTAARASSETTAIRQPGRGTLQQSLKRCWRGKQHGGKR